MADLMFAKSISIWLLRIAYSSSYKIVRVCRRQYRFVSIKSHKELDFSIEMYLLRADSYNIIINIKHELINRFNKSMYFK
jgi:hypothetical protein